MSGGGGGKTSTSTSSQTSPYAPMLAQMGLQQYKTAQPLESQIASQMMEALRTGGVNAQIPLISRAVDASRQAGSTSMQNLQEQLSRTGLANTSFGQAIMAQQAGQQGQAIAQIPTDIASQFISQAPGFATQVAGQGAGTFGQAAGLDITSKTTQTPSFWDEFMKAQELGAKAAAAYGTGGASLALPQGQP